MTSIVRWSVDKVGRSRSWDTAARCGPRGTGRGAGRASPGQLGPRGGRAGSRRAWGRPEGGRLDALRHLGPWPPRASPGRAPRGGGRPRAGSPPPRHRVCDTSRPGPGCTGGTVACARGPHGVTGCPVPAPGTVGGGGAGYRARVASRALGGGVRLPAGLGLPAAPQRAVGAGGGSLAPAGESGLVLMLPLFQWEASV